MLRIISGAPCVSRRETMTVMLRRGHVGDRVTVLMPLEQTGKQCKFKLNRFYFGPYRMLDVHLNGVMVVPVDHPKLSSVRKYKPCDTLLSRTARRFKDWWKVLKDQAAVNAIEP